MPHHFRDDNVGDYNARLVYKGGDFAKTDLRER